MSLLGHVRVAALAAATAALFALPATASAQGNGSDGLTATIEGEAKNGYAFVASASDLFPGAGANFSKEIGKSGTFTNTYSAKSDAFKGDSFKADFGENGKINVEFKEKKTTKQDPPEGCKGKASTLHKGVWKGKIKVVADNGLTKIKARKLPGSILEFNGTFDCEPGGGFKPIATLTTTPGKKTPFFGAFQSKQGKKTTTTFDASMSAGGAGYSIFVEAPNATFQHDVPDSATVTPPGPFKGKATFTGEEFGQGTLSGDLSVKFPGIGKKPVAKDVPAFLS